MTREKFYKAYNILEDMGKFRDKLSAVETVLMRIKDRVGDANDRLIMLGVKTGTGLNECTDAYFETDGQLLIDLLDETVKYYNKILKSLDNKFELL